MSKVSLEILKNSSFASVARNMASLNPAAIRMIMKQVQEVQSAPIEGVTLKPVESISEIDAELKGPEDTPFAGGSFTVSLCFCDQYPQAPPKGLFRTKIFHPNVSEKGEICVNALKKDWDPSMGLRHLLTVIRCLLIEPNPESALNEEAGRLLLEDYQEYFKRAKMMTNVYAMGPLRSVENANAQPTSGDSKTAAEKKAADKKKAALKRL